jgi:RNA polymerase sigma-70 factor (ECF subfamily)
LLVRLRRRDPEAVGTLYDRYGKIAFNLALRMLGNSELAQDVVAESVLKCWNRIASFRETRASALGLWLLTTTYATALDYRRGPESAGDETQMQPTLLERSTIFQDWSKSLDAERVQQSYAGLQALNYEETRVLELAFFEQLQPAEIADRLALARAEIDRIVASAMLKLTSLNSN